LEAREKPKKSIDYQQPVLAGSGILVLNSVQLVTTLAYGIANQTKDPEQLKELYEIWAYMFLEG
jgi:hypothetical protein